MGIATGLKNIFIALSENGGESNIVESDAERENILKNDEGYKEFAKTDSNIKNNGEKEAEEPLTTDAKRKEHSGKYDIDSLRKRLGGKDVKGKQPQINTKSKDKITSKDREIID